jgi:hypothetical protein
MKILKIVLAVVAAIMLATIPIAVLAGNTATMVNAPAYSVGITSFTVTYVSDTEMDLNWTYDATVANVMVRAKYGSYPTNPPNSATAPSDGYLVYYGSGLSAVDTSMNLNNNPDTLYYSIWGQKGDGSWNLIPSKGSEESREMIGLLLGFLAVSLLIAGLVLKKSWVMWFSIPFWVILSIYMAYYQSMGFPASAQHAFLFIGLGATVAIGFGAIRMQAKPANEHHDDDNLDDDDASTKIYKAERKKYRRSS